MEAYVLEWLNLLVRIAHVVAAIMWIGDSFLFMWMDSHLSQPEKPREGAVVGELWMTHSGGFYEVVKLKSLARLPPQLYWFKWESYSTFITGFFLISVVYYMGGRAMLVDVNSTLSQPAAVGISLGLLAGGVAVYHAICMTPLINNIRFFGVFGLVAIAGLTWGLGHVFTPRAVFLQVGAMLGTIMSSNVFFRIIPSQKEMLAATREGRPVDTSFGMRAKQRSTHNHYLTFAVLFTMVSNHLPGMYGHEKAWLVLALVFVFSVGVKYFMNLRGRTDPLIMVGTLAALGAVLAMTAPVSSSAQMAELARGPAVSFATVQQITQARCVTCHAAKPTNPAFNAPPSGVSLETPAELHTHAARMLVRAVHTKTMPLGNLTGMTDEERALMGAWIAQGANVDAAGPSVVDAVAPTAGPAKVEDARSIYSNRCVICHGESGGGDGAAGASLNPKPRNFKDAQWQASVDDAHLEKVILGGGPAVGKSAVMPGNPDLKDKKEILLDLVKLVRGFRQ